MWWALESNFVRETGRQEGVSNEERREPIDIAGIHSSFGKRKKRTTKFDLEKTWPHHPKGKKKWNLIFLLCSFFFLFLCVPMKRRAYKQDKGELLLLAGGSTWASAPSDSAPWALKKTGWEEEKRGEKKTTHKREEERERSGQGGGSGGRRERVKMKKKRDRRPSLICKEGGKRRKKKGSGFNSTVSGEGRGQVRGRQAGNQPAEQL